MLVTMYRYAVIRQKNKQNLAASVKHFQQQPLSQPGISADEPPACPLDLS
jgi:hypothetical protein